MFSRTFYLSSSAPKYCVKNEIGSGSNLIWVFFSIHFPQTFDTYAWILKKFSTGYSCLEMGDKKQTPKPFPRYEKNFL